MSMTVKCAHCGTEHEWVLHGSQWCKGCGHNPSAKPGECNCLMCDPMIPAFLLEPEEAPTVPDLPPIPIVVSNVNEGCFVRLLISATGLNAELELSRHNNEIVDVEFTREQLVEIVMEGLCHLNRDEQRRARERLNHW